MNIQWHMRDAGWNPDAGTWAVAPPYDPRMGDMCGGMVIVVGALMIILIGLLIQVALKRGKP